MLYTRRFKSGCPCVKGRQQEAYSLRVRVIPWITDIRLTFCIGVVAIRKPDGTNPKYSENFQVGTLQA